MGERRTRDQGRGSHGREAREDRTPGLIYVEFISRRPEVPLADFHRVVREANEGWDSEHGEDLLLATLGRTWRLGPEPEYLVVWYTARRGLDRIDDWEHIFRGGAAERHEQQFRRVARIDRAGCYESLREPVTARGGIYYLAQFDPASPPTVDAPATLNLLAARIGKLAPDPGGLALWTVPSFAALAPLMSASNVVAAGTYRDIGREIL